MHEHSHMHGAAHSQTSCAARRRSHEDSRVLNHDAASCIWNAGRTALRGPSRVVAVRHLCRLKTACSHLPEVVAPSRAPRSSAAGGPRARGQAGARAGSGARFTCRLCICIWPRSMHMATWTLPSVSGPPGVTTLFVPRPQDSYFVPAGPAPTPYNATPLNNHVWVWACGCASGGGISAGARCF